MAEISLAEVEHVALLARLHFSDAEKQKIASDLTAVLEHFRALQAVDTTGVPPTAHAVPRENVLREDVARPSLRREEALAEAPDARDEFFVVPRVVDT